MDPEFVRLVPHTEPGHDPLPVVSNRQLFRGYACRGMYLAWSPGLRRTTPHAVCDFTIRLRLQVYGRASHRDRYEHIVIAAGLCFAGIFIFAKTLPGRRYMRDPCRLR